MAIPGSIAGIASAYSDIFPGRGGFATNMPTYPGAYGAPYAPQDPYSKSLLGTPDAGQIGLMFDRWGNRLGQSIGSIAEPFGALSSEFKSFRKYLEDYFAKQSAPATGGTGVTNPPAGTGAPGVPVRGAVSNQTGTDPGILPGLGGVITNVGNVVTNLGGSIANPTLGGGTVADTLAGAIRPEDLFVPGPPGVVGFQNLGDGTGIDALGMRYIREPDGWRLMTGGGVDPNIIDLGNAGGGQTVVSGLGDDTLPGGGGQPDTLGRGSVVDIVPPGAQTDTILGGVGADPIGTITLDSETGLPIILGTDGQWVWASGGVGTEPPPGYMVNTEGEIVAGGSQAPGDVVTGVDPSLTGQDVRTVGQGINTIGQLVNLAAGVGAGDPTQTGQSVLALGANTLIQDALGIPNVLPGTGDILSPTTVLNPATGEIVDVPSEGISTSGALAIASGFIALGTTLSNSDLPAEQQAVGSLQGAAQIVGGLARIMDMQGLANAMPYVAAGIGIIGNAFSDKPAEQQAIEAALDTAGAVAVTTMGPWGGVVMMAAQITKIAITKLFHPDTPHRVREALETSNIGRVVSTALSGIEQAETAEDLHRVATQGNFGENDWIVNIPMTAGADPRTTLELLLGTPTANVQAGVLDQFKAPMNQALAGALKRQAVLIQAAETMTQNSPTPGRQYLASDVEYFMRNLDRYDGAPYDALNAAQVERVVGQHLMETFRRPGGGWYGPWLDPNLVYNQQGLDEPLRRRGVPEADIEAARRLFVERAPTLTEVHYSQDPAQVMAELTGLPVRTTRYFVQGAAGPSSPIEAAAEPIVAQPDGETGTETEEQRANRLYEASLAGQQGGG